MKITEIIRSKNSGVKKLFGVRKREVIVILGSISLMIGAVGASQYFRAYFEEINISRAETLPGRILMVVLASLLAFQVMYLLYNAFLYLKYKPIESVSDDELPVCTVIVPAYNEGKLVYQTLISIAESNYPKEKLEVISVDDGSKDDTWFWINKANADLGNTIKVFKQPENRGKRHALYRGFKSGKGEIFITIDSDSIIEKDTILNMVSPFVVNKKCGAVAGNVKVLNKNQGMIPRMLNVSFVFSFEFIRSAQSSLGFVLCTPGALSAYRRDAVMNCLDAWLNQKFLGQNATIGEDRAMTNMILKQGYEVKFQRNANVLTNTPTVFRTLHKMFTRWGRSNVRETLAMNSFIFSSIQMLFFTRQYNFKESLWAYPYSLFYLFGLFWVFPYSIATVKNGGWLTR